MKRLIFSLVFPIIILLLGSKALVALIGYQTLEHVKSQNEENMALGYSWISSDFSGNIIIHDVVFTPFHLKQTYRIDELTLSYAHFPALVFGLLDLKDGYWRDLQNIQLSDGSASLEGRGLVEWLAQEYDPAFRVPLGIYACGADNSLSPNQWQIMGIHAFKFDSDISLTSENDELFVNAESNFHELGILNMTAKLGSIPQNASQFNLLNTRIASINVNHIEKGFMRRLGNFCSQQSQLTQATYAQNATVVWRDAMQGIGFVIGASVEQFYEDYFKQGGQISVSITPKKPFTLQAAPELLNQSVSEQLGLALSFNGQSIDSPSLYLQSEYFRPPPKKPVKEVPVKPAFIPPEPDFKLTLWEEMEAHVGKRIRLVMTDNKVIEGIFVELKEFEVDIIQRVNGGEVAYHPKRRDIKTVEIWR